MRYILLIALFIVAVSSFKLVKLPNGQSRLLGKICPAEEDSQNPTQFADPTDCHNFYKCDNGVPVLRRCPSDLWWSTAANRCEHAENSDCGNPEENIPTTEAPESAEPESNESESDEEVEGPSELPEGCPADDDPQNPTHLSDPTDCRRFYKCDHGVPVLRRCPADLWWSSAANRCEHHENADCGNPGGSIPTEAPESAEPEPNESESDESESDEEVEGPSELPEGCPADDDPRNPTHLPDPTDCRRFYKCDHGVPVLRRCPADLWWSSAANRCEHHENSDCGNPGGSIPTEAPEPAEPEPNDSESDESGSDEEVEGPSELPEGCPDDDDPQNPTLLPDPTDCRRFYKCDHGVPVLRRCPADLWWSSAANRCEHHENSDCGNPGGSIPTEAPESVEPESNESESHESGSDEEVEGSSELPEGCPADDDPRNPTHLPDPTDCRRFYKCDHGVPVLRRCPADLWWSSAANRCEHHENSDCGNPGGSIPTEAPESAEPEPNESESDESESDEEVEVPSELPAGCPADDDPQNPTLLPDPTDCRRFYKCDHGVPVLRRCPADLWWSSAANRCEHHENADCGNPGGSIPTEAPEPAEPEPNESESDESGSDEEVQGPSELPEGCPDDDDPQNPTLLPDPTDCRRFYKCDHGVPVLRRCPADLWWSSAANRCEHHENSDCGNPGGSIPTEAPESVEPESNESESQESGGDEEVEGSSELPEGCPADDDPRNPTHLPDPTDCRRFYKCDHGVPVLRRCPADLWWSSAANRCEHHENSDCGNPGGNIPTEAPESAEPEPNESESDESGNDEEVEVPSELPEDCPDDDDPQNPTLLPDPTDCRRFYKCDHGIPVLRRCPADLWWSSAANRCEHHENSDCGNPGGSIPTEATESAEPEPNESESDESGSDEEVEGPSELPEGCPSDEDPRNPTHLPDPTDCHRFYKCDNGVPVLRRCTADLWWSSAANRCEHHENSDCASK